MDPRYPKVGFAANTATLILLISILFSAFLPFVTEKGWGLAETVLAVTTVVTIGISWWAKRENVTPVVHSHGDSESQYQALEDLPTMVSLEDNEDLVNPNTAAVIASILGESSYQEDASVKGAIETLSTGDIGKSSAEAVAMNKSIIDSDVRESIDLTHGSEPAISDTSIPEIPDIPDEQSSYAKFDMRGFQTHGIPSIPLPNIDDDKQQNVEIDLPEMLDLDDLFEDDKEESNLPPLDLPELPDFE